MNLPDLSFQKQREALSQVASAASVDSSFGQSMGAAQGLLREAQRVGATGPAAGNGITPEALAALWNGKNSALAEETARIRGQIGQGQGGPVDFGDMSDRAAYLTQGFVQRGFTPEQAQALVINLKDESGLQSAIVEGAPNVHGTRGQGLAQLTDIKPGVGRRTDYLNFMASNNRNDIWSDESQMDYLWWERNNTEKAAWDRVAQVSGVGNNASAIVEHVLRPAAEHRISRQNKYLSLGY
jgi:hypothetical protein